MTTYNVSISEAATAADSVTARLVSDAQYLEWLRADNRERVCLVEAEVYDNALPGPTTRYMSDRGYTSAPGESPANTAYEDIVLAVPEIREWMGEALRGRSLISYGEIEIDNSGGVRDVWLEDAWDKREVRIYLGDPSWARSDFRLVFRGTIEDLRARDGATLALRIRDRQLLLDKPLQTSTIAAGQTQAGQRRAVAYGKCFNVEPKVAHDGNSFYEFSDGPLSAIDNVYADGVAADGWGTKYPRGTTVYGAYFDLGSSITYRVTGHVTGFDVTTGQIVKKILLDRAGLTEADIDPAAIAAWDAAGAGESVGFYSTRDDETVGSALDALMAGIGGFYSIDAVGRFSGGILDRPELGSSTLTLTADDIADGEIEVVRRIVPPKSGRIGYKRYWSVLSYVDPSVTTLATRTRFQTEWEVAEETYTPGSQYNGVDEDLSESCFATATGADTELTRRKALWGVLHFVFRFKSFAYATGVRLGDCITIEAPRYGFDAGEKVIVVGIRRQLTRGTVELEVFR